MQNGSPDRDTLSARNVHKRFGALAVLDDINFSMHANEAVGIVGPNGAGKTTFLSVLAGAHSPSQGSVSFVDKDVSDWSMTQRCQLGLVRTHQIPKPFIGMTVFENVYVGAAHNPCLDRDQAYAVTIESLSLCGLLDRANRQAESIGLLDRKRLELARALATEPKLLLLDEIGGGLTDGEASELVDAVKELRQRGIGIIWIEHIVHVLLQATDRLICMESGKIIADGDPEKVMSDPEVIRAYLGGGVA